MSREASKSMATLVVAALSEVEHVPVVGLNVWLKAQLEAKFVALEATHVPVAESNVVPAAQPVPPNPVPVDTHVPVAESNVVPTGQPVVPGVPKLGAPKLGV